MLVKSSDNTEYKPLHKRFRQASFREQTLCERQEFSIKFVCMIVFSLSLILCGALLSELLQNDANSNYD